MAQPTRRPLVGVLLFVVTALLAGSALSSPPWPEYGPYLGLPYNACGQVGRAVSGFLLGGLGVPVFLGLWSLLFLAALRFVAGVPRISGAFFTWFLITAFVGSVFLSSIGGAPIWGGGAGTVSGWLKAGARLGPLGSGLLTGGILTWFLFLGASRWTPSPVQNRAGALAEGARGRMPTLAGARDGAAEAGERMRGWGQKALDGISWLDPRQVLNFRRSENDERERSTPAPAIDMTEEVAAALGKPTRKPKDSGNPPRRRRSAVEFSEEKTDVLEAVSPVGGYAEDEYDDEDDAYAEAEADDVEYVEEDEYDSEYDGEDEYEDDEEQEAEVEPVAPRGKAEPLFAPREAGPPPARKKPRKKRGVYPLPPLELLELPEPRQGTVTREEVIQKSQLLVKTLEDFGIQGRIGEVHPGPVITQYEYAPAAGVRISQIVSRTDDLALALKASRIRIVAPIPGKAAIGIEVPNAVAEHIDLRTVLGEVDLSDAHLPLCLGRDIRGRAQYGRLEKMPHLLVAGTTGSGKSVCLNTCLFSLLYNKRPQDMRLLMIDPKMLELTVYDGIPHLLCPVVTDARMAARMLQWMVGEMERRYRKMATFGVRNIEGYHEKMKSKPAEAEAEPMPYIVVIVDELADLMLTLGNEIETPIARLAQMARAVGIHLILATQRPSVDVITGVIKANFPGRIAFQVATKVDSRTIIDGNGAENLLGKGDMLYLPPGKGSPVRLHGAFVSDADAERLVEYLKEMPEPEPIFREEMLDKETDGAEIDDELFEDALRLVVYQKQASVSFLQRRLKVGYSRAGRLMDLLEGAGAVGPHEGSKPREVLADEGFLESWANNAPAASE